MTTTVRRMLATNAKERALRKRRRSPICSRVKPITKTPFTSFTVEVYAPRLALWLGGFCIGVCTGMFWTDTLLARLKRPVYR